MAIQPRKIPTPSEIKTSPHSFSEQELKQLRDLREKLNQLTLQFGQISINILKLKQTKEELKNQLKELENEESNIAKTLSKKYGDGSIDLDSGTFTPLN